jgi:hypothetical protein
VHQQSVTEVRLRPGPSKTLALTFLLVWVLTLGVVSALPFSWPIDAGLATAVLVYGAWSFHHHCLLRGDVITEANVRADGGWEVTTARNGTMAGDLRPDNLVLPWLTVLNFKLADERRRSLLLLSDNVAADTFRRLRVRLRFGAD